MKRSLVSEGEFESYDFCEEEARKRIKCLNRSQDERCYNLGLKLEDCMQEIEVCESVACPICNRERRIKLVKKYCDIINYENRESLFVTVLYYNDWFDVKCFNDFDITKFKSKFRSDLKRSGFHGPIVGSFEFDFQLPSNKISPHAHILIPNTERNVIALKNLKKSLAKNEYTILGGDYQYRPVHFIKVYDVLGVVKYIFKFMYFERYRYFSTAGKRGSRKRRMSKEVFSDFLLGIDELKLESLVLYWDKQGRW